MYDSKQVFSPGTVLDKKYRIDRLIGSGGMGEVYAATHTAIGRKVAIKTLRAMYTQNDTIVARFQQEARMAGSIGHDHICEVTDIGKHEDSVLYLVMPLLTGGTLSELLDKDEMTVSRLVDIAQQVLLALQAAHDAQIVHRDLKPSNIFVTKFGQTEDVVKLLDFGISKMLRPDRAATSLTQTGSISGTIFYMSPEQARGSKDIDHRVDIYSLGVIMFEALTGAKPFDGDSDYDVLHKIVTSTFTSPRYYDSSIPVFLEDIILKAMSARPDDRYQTADEMRKALEAFAAKGFRDTRISSPGTRTAITTPGSGILPAIRGNAGSASPISIRYADPVTDSSQEILAIKTRTKKQLMLILSVCGVLVIAVIVLLAYAFGGDDEAPITVPPAFAPAGEGRAPAPETEPAAPVRASEPAPGEMEAVVPESTDPVVETGRTDDARSVPLPETRGPSTSERPRDQAVEALDEGPKKKDRVEREKKPTTRRSKKDPSDRRTKKEPSDKVKGRFGTDLYTDYDD